ncbi:MAG: right-handed parallel beta-helix repeat-containing protein [Thermoanaerobaculia bacterium]|nr:right-handed parallel beta-helix repeat-containing protein [Thermoanaerobaculia bacterium]
MRGDAAEFQVNVYTTYNQSRPDVAMAPDGSFVVVWQSAGSFEGDVGQSIQVRRFDRAGQPMGAREWQVNSLTSVFQSHPRVAMDFEGNFVVVWDSTTSVGNDTSFASIQARRFRADGTALDEQQFQVNTYTTDDQTYPDVIVHPEGEFVVVWQSFGSPGDDQSFYSTLARRFAATGEPLDAVEFQVNSYTANSQLAPAVAVLPGGGFVVIWQSDDDGGGFGRSVKVRRFGAEGNPIDPENRVDTLEGLFRYEPAIASDPAGGFVAVWPTLAGSPGGFEYHVNARRYRPDGTPVSQSEQPMSVRTALPRNRPAVGVGPNGDFVVAWQGYHSLPDDEFIGINARRVRHDDSIVEAEELQLNAYTTEAQALPSVAVGPDGDFVVVWQSWGSWGSDTSGNSIQARRFPRPVTVVTTADGVPGCSLADAIEAANLGTAVGDCPAGDEGAILELPAESRFSIAAPDNGSNALPVVRRPITIRGSGARIERDPGLACPAGPLFRLFEVGEGGTLTLEDVAVSNGCLAAESGAGILAEGGVVVLRGAAIEGNETAGDGGGLAVVDGHLIADGATVRGNLAGGAGGGVVISGPGSSATVRGSTLSTNVAVQGGGLWWGAGLPAIVRNSTFSGNASQSGGGIEIDASAAEFVAEFVTVTQNEAPLGAGLHAPAGNVALHGALVGDNVLGADCAGAGAWSASGANLDTDGSCAALAGAAVTTVGGLGLGPLVDLGGASRGHLPGAASPAVDAAPSCAGRGGEPIGVDQRGYRRPTDDDGDELPACELGAIERGPVFLDGFELGDLRRWSANRDSSAGSAR